MIKWTGYAVCEELQKVQPFTSTHSRKDGAIEAVRRAIWGECGFCAAIEVECFRADSKQGENFEELAEFAARDSVTGCYGIDEGFELLPVVDLEPRGKTLVQEARADTGAPKEILEALLFGMMNAFEAHEEDDIRSDFIQMTSRMAAYYN